MATITVRDENRSLSQPEEISAFLAPFGIWYRRFEGSDQLPENATDQEPDDGSVLALVATLTPRRRAAIVLRFYFDLSVDDTAEVLGCSPGTVKSLTARGLGALQSRLTAESAPQRRRTAEGAPRSRPAAESAPQRRLTAERTR